MKRGMNSSEMQKNNRMLVFRTLLENGSMTRTALASEIGLQKATITNIINEFLEMGIIAIDGDVASGRRGENICLKLDGIYTMSIGITRKDYQIGVFSLLGENVSRIRYRFNKNENIHSVLQNLKKSVLKCFEKFGKKKIVGICLAVPGLYITRPSGENETFQITEFEEFNQVNIRKELENALGVPVMMKHDAKLAAYAEWRNAKEAQEDEHASLIVIRSRGFGIGAGIVINGKIVEGQLGIAGEIGHMGINFNRKKDESGYSGSYEYCAGTESVLRYVQERIYEYPQSVICEESTYQEIVEAYKNGDPLAVWAMEKMAWMLGYGIANIIYVINPDCIILGPDYPDLPSFIEKVKEALKFFVPETVINSSSLRYSSLSEDSFLLGGYYYVLEQLYKENKILEKIRNALI